MSGHGDPHDEAGADPHDGHDHDDDHHAPPALEEPATPLWLTFLGLGLFLVAGILFIASRPSGKTTAELTATANAEAPTSAAPAAAAPPAAPNPALRVPAPRPNPGARPPQPAAGP
jgi:hypothetical protein